MITESLDLSSIPNIKRGRPSSFNQRKQYKRENNALFQKKAETPSESWWIQPMSREQFDQTAAARFAVKENA
jgi:hypothetical protein